MFMKPLFGDQPKHNDGEGSKVEPLLPKPLRPMRDRPCRLQAARNSAGTLLRLRLAWNRWNSAKSRELPFAQPQTAVQGRYTAHRP